MSEQKHSIYGPPRDLKMKKIIIGNPEGETGGEAATAMALNQ
jgi:hypothetical protein